MSTDYEREDDVIVIDREKEDHKTHEPPKYKVIMVNDDFTPMDWVVDMLQSHFSKTMEAAIMIMTTVHEQGKAVAGVYTKDIAETKAGLVNQLSQNDGHPFRLETEPE